jgi:hypothetical protein
MYHYLCLGTYIIETTMKLLPVSTPEETSSRTLYIKFLWRDIKKVVYKNVESWFLVHHVEEIEEYVISCSVRTWYVQNTGLCKYLVIKHVKWVILY